MTFYGTMINPFGGHQNHCLFLCAKLSQLTASPGCVGNRKAKPHLDLASTLCAQSHPRLFGLTRVTTIDLGAEINSFKPTPGEYTGAPSSGTEHLDSQSGPGRQRAENVPFSDLLTVVNTRSEAIDFYRFPLLGRQNKLAGAADRFTR